MSDIVILESVYCNGTTDSRECDRACFFLIERSLVEESRIDPLGERAHWYCMDPRSTHVPREKEGTNKPWRVLS